ncbi:MAG: DUF3422 domain-containing protein [Nocardioides sp.]|nr:DUF3422 domain-containing protein [Nocardioides sp.]
MPFLLPPDAAERVPAHNEVHVRPARPLPIPSMTTQITVLTASHDSTAEASHLRSLAATHGAQIGSTDVGLVLNLGDAAELSWERHDEYSVYTIHQPFDSSGVAADTNLLSYLPLPAGWLTEVPGHTVAAVHVLLVDGAGRSDEEAVTLAETTLGQQGRLVGSRLRDSCARLFTTFRLHPDGTSRFLLVCDDMTAGRAGRVSGSLLEVERYRTLALLAYPSARALILRLSRLEEQLADLVRTFEDEQRDDHELLDDLILLAASVERDIASHTGRFSAARAYFALVQQRIDYLRGGSLPGLMGVFTFLLRRLVPAISTVESAQTRIEELSGRVSRTADVLRTRVEVEAQSRTQELLSELRRGQTMQLRLQQTVEGLSVAAISYYLVALVGIGAKGLHSVGLSINASLAQALAIPLAVWLVWRTVHRARRIHPTSA